MRTARRAVRLVEPPSVEASYRVSRPIAQRGVFVLAMATYFIQRGTGGAIKIGRACDPRKRLADLQVACDEKLSLLGTMEGDEREVEMHARFAHLNIRGEWFTPDTELTEFIRWNTKHDSDCEMLREACRRMLVAYDAMQVVYYEFAMWLETSKCHSELNASVTGRDLDEAVVLIRKTLNETEYWDEVGRDVRRGCKAIDAHALKQIARVTDSQGATHAGA